MTTTQKFNTTYENKFKSLRPFLRHTARGDEDLIQEGAISILESLKRIPDAPNKYLRTGVRWSILNQVNGVGKSVDIPKRYNRQFPITMPFLTIPTLNFHKPFFPIETGFRWTR